jgi:hypothetical protein
VSRTTRRKIYRFLTISIGTALLLGVILRFHLSIGPIALLVLALLIPGRILGFFWRDQLAGLRLLNERRFQESAQCSSRFLDLLGRRPWIRHLNWLGGGCAFEHQEGHAASVAIRVRPKSKNAWR